MCTLIDFGGSQERCMIRDDSNGSGQHSRRKERIIVEMVCTFSVDSRNNSYQFLEYLPSS